MKRTACPFLGLKDDPTTVLSFPSDGNFCHHARPIAPPNSDYQEKYCLTADHFKCPIYQAARPVPLPGSIAAPTSTLIRRRVLALLAIPLLIAGIAAAWLGWNLIQGAVLNQSEIPETGKSNLNGESLFGPGTPQDNPTLSPLLPFAVVTPAAPTIVNCPMPEGWVTYIINPTDSLYRLSVIYGVSIEEFQRVNCMGNQTVVLPGQVIYVPYIPTSTPFVPTRMIDGQQQTVTIRPPVIPPPVDATMVPFTLVPATKVPYRTPTRINTVVSTPTSIFSTKTITPSPTSSATRQPSNTIIPPARSATARPTNTLVPTSTATWQPSDTPRPAHTRRPSKTPKSPTATLSLPLQTNTAVIPTNTLLPTATDTPVPPPPSTDTPVPPLPVIDTPVAPPPDTATPEPQLLATDTPSPLPLATDTPTPLLSILWFITGLTGGN